MKYNYRIKNLKCSNISSFNQYLKSIDDIVLLTYGDPQIEVKKEIKDEMINAILEGNDHYVDGYGLIETRNSICAYENRFHKVNYNSDNCLVCNGSTDALFLCLSTLICSNDEIIVITPNYPLYDDIITYLGGKVVYYHLDENDTFNCKTLKSLINNQTKAIILNYPNNPTGKVLSLEEVNNLYKLLKNYDFAIILDNIYQEFSFEKSYSLLDFPELFSRIILINSLSKFQQLTGWRIGYMLANKELIDYCHHLHQRINVCVSGFVQKIVPIALSLPSDIAYYLKNKNYVLKELDCLKVPYYEPQGGFYIFINIKQYDDSSYDFCKKLADEYHIGLLPGIFFNKEGYCRLSLTSDFNTIKKAMKRLRIALKAMKITN